jgi:hypothetical protein
MSSHERRETVDPVGLDVADAGDDHGRDAAASEEEDAHHRQIAEALKGVRMDRLQEGDRLLLGQGGVAFFWTPGDLSAAMSWAVSYEMSPLAASCW